MGIYRKSRSPYEFLQSQLFRLLMNEVKNTVMLGMTGLTEQSQVELSIPGLRKLSQRLKPRMLR